MNALARRQATDPLGGEVSKTELRQYTVSIAYDLWSFGCLLFHLVYASPLWLATSEGVSKCYCERRMCAVLSAMGLGWICLSRVRARSRRNAGAQLAHKRRSASDSRSLYDYA